MSLYSNLMAALFDPCAVPFFFLVILFCLFMPPLGQMSRPVAIEQIKTIDTSLAALEQALAKRDWAAMPEQVD
jgi:uncharacterized membrane protein YhhN